MSCARCGVLEQLLRDAYDQKAMPDAALDAAIDIALRPVEPCGCSKLCGDDGDIDGPVTFIN